MNIAEQYFQKHLRVDEFKHSYLQEKVKLDIEYQLEELKNDIRTVKPVEELIKKIECIEKYVMTV